jgi:hypothetical protein
MLRNNLKLRQNHFISSFYQFANSVSPYAATGLKLYSYDLYSGSATVRGSNPGCGGGEIFRIHPDQRGSPSFLYKGYCVSYLRIKRPGRGVDHPPPQRPRLKRDSITPFPFWAFMACYRVDFTLSGSNSWREHILSWLGEMGLPFSQGQCPPSEPRLVPPSCFPNHYLLLILQFDVIRSALLILLKYSYMVYLKGLCKLQDFPTQK